MKYFLMDARLNVLGHIDTARLGAMTEARALEHGRKHFPEATRAVLANGRTAEETEEFMREEIQDGPRDMPEGY